MMNKILYVLIVLLAFSIPACSSDSGGVEPNPARFVDGTTEDPQIGWVANSTGNALTLFQVGDPAEQRTVSFGASTQITVTGTSTLGDWIAVPLGNAASVALIDVNELAVDRFLLLDSGNTTGSTFVDGSTLLVANLIDDFVARFDLSGAATEPNATVEVAPAPTAILMFEGVAYVLSGNLDEGFVPLGDGVVTAIDPETMTVLGTVSTGATNPQDMDVGPDGNLYVVNTEDFVGGSVAVIDPVTLQRTHLETAVGSGPGRIDVDAQGRAFISAFFGGTVIWDTSTRTFLRGPENPLCAPLSEGGCRGAIDATVDSDGRVYQAFFGSPSQDLAPLVFVYEANGWVLSDSVSVGPGPASIDIGSFR